MWIKVNKRLPEEGSVVIASSGLAWGIALFEDGEFQFETRATPSPTGPIIEWMIPEPSFNKNRRGKEMKIKCFYVGCDEVAEFIDDGDCYICEGCKDRDLREETKEVHKAIEFDDHQKRLLREFELESWKSRKEFDLQMAQIQRR